MVSYRGWVCDWGWGCGWGWGWNLKKVQKGSFSTSVAGKFLPKQPTRRELAKIILANSLRGPTLGRNFPATDVENDPF
jgi:hypothetical protein